MPMLLEAQDGIVRDSARHPWFAEWLFTGFRQHSTSPVTVRVEQFRDVRKVVLLNCLDRLYGHTLLKLLNAQRHLERVGEFSIRREQGA